MTERSPDRAIDRRTAIGFILSPLIGGLLFSVFATWPMAIAIGLENGALSAMPHALIVMIALPFVGVLVTAPVMYIGMCVIGLPALVLFRRFGIERWWLYGIWGTAWTVPPLFALWRTPPLWITPAGGIILIVFWAIARRNR